MVLTVQINSFTDTNCELTSVSSFSSDCPRGSESSFVGVYLAEGLLVGSSSKRDLTQSYCLIEGITDISAHMVPHCCVVAYVILQ